MDVQLEIVSMQSTQQLNDNNDGNHINGNITNNKSTTQQWLRNTFESIINKLTKQEKQSHQHQFDDWEIPFERIKVNQKDYKKCGSQGDVFHGKLSNSSVAVKRVKDSSLTNIRHLRQLNHPNIIKFKGVSQDLNYHYIIMEFCPYGTLHDHIHSERHLSSKTLCKFAQQITNGMKYLHSKFIIHRDLKPSNILLTHNDVLKISDFGTHKLLDGEITRTSVSCIGTPAYMAPEVIRSEPYSYPVDVWSFGVVLWEILIGDEPYKNLHSLAVVCRVGTDSSCLPVPYSLPAGFKAILNGCWVAQPSKRMTFNDVWVFLGGAFDELKKMPEDLWPSVQVGWRREVREEMEKRPMFKVGPEACISCKQRHQELDDMREQAQRRRDKNNHIYLELQECSMHLQQDKKRLALREEAVARREDEVARREDNISQREKEVARREKFVSEIESNYHTRVNELNQLKEITLGSVETKTDDESINTNL